MLVTKLGQSASNGRDYQSTMLLRRGLISGVRFVKMLMNHVILSIALVSLSQFNFADTVLQKVETQVLEKPIAQTEPHKTDVSNSVEQVDFITSDDFDQEAVQSNLPVLIVFTAPWCGPCKILDPVIETLMPEMSGQAKVFKLDTDESPEISTKYKVTRLPTIIYFNKEQEVYRSSSVYPREAYIHYLQQLKEDISIEESRLQLLDKDWFRRHFLVMEEIEYIEKVLEELPNLLTRPFDNGQTPLSLVLNYPSDTRRELLELVLAQQPEIGANDLLGLGRCEEFEKLVAEDPDAINRPDSDGNTPLFTAIMGSSLLEHGDCVGTILELGGERNLPTTIRNSLGEPVLFEPDSTLIEDLLMLLPKQWVTTWHNDDIGVKIRMLFYEMYRARGLQSEDLIASRTP